MSGTLKQMNYIDVIVDWFEHPEYWKSTIARGGHEGDMYGPMTLKRIIPSATAKDFDDLLRFKSADELRLYLEVERAIANVVEAAT